MVEEPAQADQVAFGRVDAPSGLTIMADDLQPSKDHDPGSNPCSIVLQGTDGDEIQPRWERLAEDASTVLIPSDPPRSHPCTGW